MQLQAPEPPLPAALPPIGPGPTLEMLRMLWASPFPATLQDPQFRLVAVNDAYLDFTGRTREALIGTDPVLLQPLEDQATHIEARRELPAQLAGQTVPRLSEQRLIDASDASAGAAPRPTRCRAKDGEPLLLCVLQDSTAEHVARAQADRSLNELAQWFDLSPTGMLVFDEAGLIVRSNPAFEALVGQVPVMLNDASAELQALLAWQQGAPRPELRPGATPLEIHVSLALPDGRRQRLSARVRGFATDQGQHRFMAVVEDRSAEEERDLAQLEIGALMDTAGVGVATFDSARGWLRPRAERRRAPAKSAGLQSIARDIVEPESLPEYETAAAGAAPRRAHRGALCRQPCRAGPALAADAGRAGRWRFRPAHRGHGRRDRAGKRAAPEPAAAARADHHPRRHDGRHRLPARRDAGALQPPLRIDARPGGRRGGRRDHHRAVRPLPAGAGRAAGRAELRDRTGRVRHGRCGAPAWYSLSVRRAEPAAGDNEVVAVLTDISRLKSQQTELEALLRDRELMFSLSDVGIAYLRGGRIERANQAMAALTGYADSELTALDPAELALDRDEHLRQEQDELRMLRQQGRYHGERQLRRRDGSLRLGAGGAAPGRRGRRAWPGASAPMSTSTSGTARARSCCARPSARGRCSIRCWWASSPSATAASSG